MMNTFLKISNSIFTLFFFSHDEFLLMPVKRVRGQCKQKIIINLKTARYHKHVLTLMRAHLNYSFRCPILGG